MAVTRRSRELHIDEETLLNQIRLDAAQDINTRAEWLENRTRILEKYRGIARETMGLFEDSYSVNIPIAMMNVNRMQATMVNAILAGNPLVNARATDPSNLGSSERRVERALESEIRYRADGENVIDEFTNAAVYGGKGILKITWDYVVRKEKFVRNYGPIGDEANELEFFMAVLADIYGPPGGENEWSAKKIDANDFEVTYRDPERMFEEEITDLVQFFPEDHRTEVEIFGERVWKRQPKWQVVDWEDLLVPTNATGMQPGEAQHIIQIMKLPLNFIRENEDRIFNRLRTRTPSGKNKLDELERAIGDTEPMETQIEAVKDLFDEIEGIDREASDSATDQLLPVWECYYTLDIDDDGQDEEVVLWIVPRGEGILLGARYLTELFPHRKRPYAEWNFAQPEVNRWYGSMGIPEMVEGLSDLINILETQSLDVLALSALPPGFYRATAGIRPETIKYQYGEMIPLDNPQTDIVFPRIAADHRGFIEHETLLQQYLDKLVVLSDPQFGQAPQRGSSTLRTARGVQAIIAQGDVSAERYLRRLFRGLTEAVNQTYALMQTFGSATHRYRRYGFVKETEDAFVILEPKDTKNDYIFEFTVNTLQSNKAIMREVSQLMLQTLVNPLLIQFGIVTPGNVFEVADFFLRHHEMEDTSRFLTRPPQFAEPPLMPEVVVQQLIQGREDLEPHPLGQLQAEFEMLLQLQEDPTKWIQLPGDLQQNIRTYIQKLKGAIVSQQQREAFGLMATQFQQSFAAAQSQGSPDVSPASRQRGEQPTGFGQSGAGPTGTPRRSSQ